MFFHCSFFIFSIERLVGVSPHVVVCALKAHGKLTNIRLQVERKAWQVQVASSAGNPHGVFVQSVVRGLAEESESLHLRGEMSASTSPGTRNRAHGTAACSKTLQ